MASVKTFWSPSNQCDSDGYNFALDDVIGLATRTLKSRECVWNITFEYLLSDHKKKLGHSMINDDENIDMIKRMIL